MKYKIAVVGSKEIWSLFSAIWAESIVINSKEEAFWELMKLKKERQDKNDEESPLKYAIILVVEDLLLDISDEDYLKLSQWSLPSIISIPSSKWPSWYWNAKIKRIVEKATWSDIFW